MIRVSTSNVMQRIRSMMLSVGTSIVYSNGKVDLPSTFEIVYVAWPLYIANLVEYQSASRPTLGVFERECLLCEDFIHRCMTVSYLNVLKIWTVNESHFQLQIKVRITKSLGLYPKRIVHRVHCILNSFGVMDFKKQARILRTGSVKFKQNVIIWTTKAHIGRGQVLSSHPKWAHNVRFLNQICSYKYCTPISLKILSF